MRIFQLLSFVFLFSFLSCNNPSADKQTDDVVDTVMDEVAATAPFSVIIEEDSSRTFLPALQSFVLAVSNDNWLMMAGRTNGMHKFIDYEEQSFPSTMFNQYIYACGTTQCDSIAVSVIPMPYQSMFRATNLQHYQDGNDLYITGGYGENPTQTDTLERWDTYDYIAKIDVSALITAIQNQDTQAVNAAMVFGQSAAVEATGGELFKIGDYFYLTVGHQYNGIYSSTGNGGSGPVQVYLDAVHRFKVGESNGQLSVTEFTKITDGYPDDSTQFRRRDLPVVAGLRMNNGTPEASISMFAGVFTNHKNLIPGLKPDANFTHPIYIHQDGTYQLDDTYTQDYNVYACANFAAYDANSNMLYSTLIGGIGDNTKQIGFTKNVLTINQNLMGGTTTSTTQTAMNTSHHFGAEANIVLSDAQKTTANNLVFDITGLNSGDVVDVGVFYGGIEAIKANPGGYGQGLSYASDKVFKVSIKMN